MTMTETTKQDECYDEAKRHAADLERVCGILLRVRDRSEAGLDTWDELLEQLEEYYLPDPLSISVTLEMDLGTFVGGGEPDKSDVKTVEVLLGTGGPASGIRFYDSDRAEVWHQDWFTTKAYAGLDSEVAEYLAGHWGLWEVF